MADQAQAHPVSEQVVRCSDAVVVFTPCHARQVCFPAGQAVPQAVLRAVCPQDDRLWLVELVADETVESGLRPAWRDPRVVTGGGTIEGPVLIELGRLHCWTPCHGYVISLNAAEVIPGVPVPVFCRCRALWIVELSPPQPAGGTQVALWRCVGPDPRLEQEQ